MKKFKIILVCLIFAAVLIPTVYAYWTDTVNTKIDLTITYDGYLTVLDVSEPAVSEAPKNGDIPADGSQEGENSESQNSDDNYEEEINETGINNEDLQNDENISEDLQDDNNNNNIENIDGRNNQQENNEYENKDEDNDIKDSAE